MSDLISRQAAIDAVAKWFYDVFGIKESDGTATIFKRLRELPSAQPEITEDDVKEYCRKRCLIVVTSDFYDEMTRRWASAQPETHDKRTETHACDLIDRQQAIDAVVRAMIDGADAELVEGVMELLPSAQPEWIPCSERLPEDNVPVNITWINRKPEFYYAEIKDVPFTATGVYFKGKWYWYSSTVEDYLAEYGRAEWDEIEEAMHNSIEVVAWMPLPKPYGGESE